MGGKALLLPAAIQGKVINDCKLFPHRLAQEEANRLAGILPQGKLNFCFESSA
jgi:hypothetical protein